MKLKFEYQNKLAEELAASLAEVVGVPVAEIKWEHPTTEEHGDWATAVALNLKFKIKNLKLSPREQAEKLVETWQKRGLPDYVDRAEAAGPGFINVWLKKEYLITQLQEVLEAKEKYGRSDFLDGKKIMVEFAHPNTHKELHIGHMRTLITGEALARIFTASGAAIFRANYQGDIGPHVAKSLWGTQKLMIEKKLGWEAVDDWSLAQKAHLLGEGYVYGVAHYSDNKAEIDALNQKLYRHDPAVWPVYEQTRAWSLAYYQSFYERFYTRFDQLFFESEVADQGKKLVLKNLGRVFAKGEGGAIIFDGKKYGLHKRVFITATGTPTYEAKDMALVYAQFKAFSFDLNIHIVANEQAGYFQVIIKAMEIMDPLFVDRQYHLSMGMVQLVGQKMSSRTGVILKVDDLIEGVKKAIRLLIKNEELKGEAKEILAEKIAIGAIKYSILATDPTQNALFDLQKSISLEGNSGPYLQYTYARCQSVLAKSGQSIVGAQFIAPATQEELSLLRTLYRFPEAVGEATVNFAPNLICNYLYDLAQKFNTFYNKHRVIGSDQQEFRLALTAATGQVLRNGLTLLGIIAPERM
ncbi:MAG: arginine--tRNA ligase [Candidatus Shapirobacteria bacterium]